MTDNNRFQQLRFCYKGNIGLRIQFSLFLVILFMAGCQTELTEEDFQATSPTIAPTATIAPTTTVEEAATSTLQPIATVIPTEMPTTTPTPSQPPAMPTPDIEMLDWSNNTLITYTHEDGIYRFDLETEESERLVPIFNSGIAWMSSASPSYNGQEVVYWFVEGPWYVVKAVNTVTGYDRPLLNINDDGFTDARGAWLGQGRFFELAIWGEDENGVPLVKQWYLFDIPNDTIIGSADDKPGTKVCHTIAVSPKSGRIASWCSFEPQFNEDGTSYVEQGDYIVIEANGESWSTSEPPEQVMLETFGIDSGYIWSPNGNYVIVPRTGNATIIDVNSSDVFNLFTEDDYLVSTYDAQFAPDESLLSYEFAVCESRSACPRLLDFETGATLWDSSGLFADGLAKFSTWSPDGKFFAVDVDGSREYIILDSHNFSVAKTLSNEVVTLANWVVWLHPTHE